MNDINSLGVTHGSDASSSVRVANSLFPPHAPKMGVCRTALVDDGYQSGILVEGPVWKLCDPRTGFSTDAAPGMCSVSRAGLHPRRAKRLAKPMARTLQKNIRVTPGQWNRIENAARERDVSANRLVVELALEALDHREWPRTDLEIQLLRSSMFAAQAIARDMKKAGRESEIDEISHNISEIAPDLPYKTPGLAQPDLRLPASPDDA